ncbi:hypothetical protein ACJMK2_022853 [Sinanodonta woodiana]|uniref:Uncharacterized protein n=1 Tax=Sinanodonta woodiana TaxID=1069815 RepID=A0ABD3TKA4_SINWO
MDNILGQIKSVVNSQLQPLIYRTNRCQCTGNLQDQAVSVYWQSTGPTGVSVLAIYRTNRCQCTGNLQDQPVSVYWQSTGPTGVSVLAIYRTNRCQCTGNLQDQVVLDC